MSDQAIQQETRGKGFTAPCVTPEMVEAAIASEHYSTAADGFRFNWLTEDHALALDRDNVESIAQGIRVRTHSATSAAIDASAGTPPMLGMLTFCVLVTRNGHLVSGEAYCADPAKFNAETGRNEARKVAIDKLWPMLVYAERDRLAG